MMATKKQQIKPFFAYAGGKSTMAKHILPLIPPHICYVEPFFGSGVIFWKKDQAKVSVINDLNHEVVNFWRVVGTKLDELIAELKLTLYSRYEFERATKIRRECKQYNELQRAWAFFVSQNQCFNGKDINTWMAGSNERAAMQTNVFQNKIKNIEELKDLIKDKLDGCEYSDLEQAWAFFVSQNQCFGAGAKDGTWGYGNTANAGKANSMIYKFHNKIENIEELKEQIKEKLDGCEYSDLEQAWAFFVSQNQCFGSVARNNNWGYSKDGRQLEPFDNTIKNIEEFIDIIKTRVKKTFIECRPATKVIKQFDGPDTFHFLDPPYINTEQTQYKGNEYNKDDMIELLELCATLQGKFMLTHYDNPLIREHAEKNKWTVKEVTRTSSVANAKAGAKARPKKTELIVMNYNNELF